MSRSFFGRTAFAACVAMFGVCQMASANMLVNPGFEDGFNGWIPFGNAYPETSNPPEIDPYEGVGEAKMFGNFSGGFDVTGIFQEFPASPGDMFTMSSKSRHWSGDPLIGGGSATNENWVVQKIVFKDAGDVEIGAVESTILDGTFATDVWYDNAPIMGMAPANTVQVEAFILYLQPMNDGGAAHIDNVVLTPEPTALALLAIGGCGLLRRRR